MRNSILILLLLTGCATQHPTIQTVIQKVEVPISTPCTVTFPTKPELTFGNISPQQDIYDKTKSLLSDRELQLGYEVELEAALGACK